MKLEDNAIIMEYLQGKGDLSKKQKEKLNNCSKCADFIKQYGSRQKVVKILQNTITLNGEPINEREAYVLFDDTQHIFNVSKKDRKDFYIDMLLGNIFETREKAIKDKDFKTAATCDKNFMELLREFFGTEDNPNFKNIQPVNISVGFFPELLKTDIPKNIDEIAKELMKVKRKANDSSFEDAQVIREDE